MCRISHGTFDKILRLLMECIRTEWMAYWWRRVNMRFGIYICKGLHYALRYRSINKAFIIPQRYNDQNQYTEYKDIPVHLIAYPIFLIVILPVGADGAWAMACDPCELRLCVCLWLLLVCIGGPSMMIVFREENGSWTIWNPPLWILCGTPPTFCCAGTGVFGA